VLLDATLAEARLGELVDAGSSSVGRATSLRSANRRTGRAALPRRPPLDLQMKAYGLPRNPLATVERSRVARSAGIDVFSREEVMALVRAAQDDQDGVLYLTAAAARRAARLRWETSTSTPPRTGSVATGPMAVRARSRAAAIAPSR
jgi:hypothetical protein